MSGNARQRERSLCQLGDLKWGQRWPLRLPSTNAGPSIPTIPLARIDEAKRPHLVLTATPGPVRRDTTQQASNSRKLALRPPP